MQCCKCGVWKNRSEFYRNTTGVRGQCKVCWLDRQRARYKNDPAHRKRMLEYNSAYRKANRKKLRMLENTRVKSDWEKLKKALGSELRRFAMECDSARLRKLMGCTRAEFRAHIEAQFEPWMHWGNRGRNIGEYNVKWSFDRIIPYAAFKELEDYKYVVCHYTNVRPLCAKKNAQNQDHYEEEAKQDLIRTHIIRDYLKELIG